MKYRTELCLWTYFFVIVLGLLAAIFVVMVTAPKPINTEKGQPTSIEW